MIALGYILSATLSFFGLLLAFRFRRVPGAYAFMALSALTCWAAAASSYEYSAVGLEDKLLWRNLQQISYFYIPVSVLAVSAAYSAYADRIGRRKLTLVSLVPTAALVLLYTNDFHHLMRTAVELNAEGRIAVERTALNDLFLLFGFFLNVASLGLLVRTLLLTKGAQRRQAAVLTIAVALPFVIGLLRTIGVFPVTGYAASIAMTYLPASLVMIWGVFKYQLLQAVPIGRNQLVEALAEGVLVVDAETRVLDANAAAVRLLARIAGRDVGDLQGREISREAWPHLDAWLEAHASRSERTVEVAVGAGAERTYIAMKVMPVWGARTRYGGSITVMTDMTDVKRKERELRRSASTDDLTGAYNRSAFIDRTNQLLGAANALDQPFALLVLDIDDFKRINDTYGHQAGDEAIRAVAHAVAGCLDRTQPLGRIGGEEFAVALPGLDLAEAVALAEAIRSATARADIRRDGARFGATISVGVAARGESGATYDALFQSADRRLYYAKRSGRNRVEAGETTEVPSVVK